MKLPFVALPNVSSWPRKGTSAFSAIQCNTRLNLKHAAESTFSDMQRFL